MKVSSFFIILTFTLSLAANAVMQPDVAFRGTGLPNHLMSQDLGQQLRAVTKALQNFAFPAIPLGLSPYLYSEENMKSEEVAALRMTAIFNSVIRRVSGEDHLLYKNIFYGHDVGIVLYDFKEKAKGGANNLIFWIENPGEKHFKIHVAKDLAHNPILDKMVRLAALMTVEMQGNLIHHFGGIEVYRESHLKVQWVSEIFSGFLLWQLSQRLPENGLRDQIVHLEAMGASSSLLSQLNDLESEFGSDQFKLWYTRWLRPQSEMEYVYIDDIMNLAIDLMENHFLSPNHVDWLKADDGQQAQRTLLAFTLAGESILVRKCAGLLTSYH